MCIRDSKYSKLTALIATSFLFLLLHPGAINSGLTASINVFGAGLIFGLITIKFDSLICATFAHTAVSYTHLRAHETVLDLVCRLLLEKKKTLINT